MFTCKHLNRRSFLSGTGAAIFLLFLDAMIPAFAASSQHEDIAPRRLAFVYIPNGVIQEARTPDTEGTDYEFTRTLKSLEPFRKDLMVLSGLTHNTGRALGDGPGDHARAASSFLTGIHPHKTAGADIKLGISVDQVSANEIGDKTRFASLELGIEPGRLAGNCDSGYSCAYSNSISWRGEKTPNPPEINPRMVYERMFGEAWKNLDPATLSKRRAKDKSVLDYILSDASRLRNSVGPTDRQKLNEYFSSVRDVKNRIENDSKFHKEATPHIEALEGIPAEYPEHARVMFDLMALAYQTDITWVATFMIGREGSNLTYPEISVNRAHHGMTHHRGEPDKIEDITKVNVHHVEQFSYFLGKLASIQEGEGRLLDNIMAVYGSGIGDGNRHTHHDLPVILAGGGSGTLHQGRHLSYPLETPMNNLYMSLLDRVGVHTETLGDGNGKLEHLSGI